MNRLTDQIDRMMTLATGDAIPALTIKALAAMALTLVAWLILKTILRIVQKRLTAFELISINASFFSMIRRAIGLGLLLLAGTYLIRLFQLPMAENLLQALFILLFAAPVKDFLGFLITHLEQKWTAKTETKVDDVIIELLDRFSGAIIYAVAVVLALDILGVNVIPFVAGAGILGVAIGFAAKDTLSNLIAGILLIIDRPFEIGDRIEVWSAPAGSASWGDVIDIGLRATKIKTTDNIIIVIPNNEIMKRDIVNYTLNSTQIRVRINLGVAYDTPIEKAKRAILQVASQIDWISKDPEPKVVVRSFGESAVELQLRVWIQDARQRMNTISAVTDQIKNVFDQEGIEIPFPKRDIRIITSPQPKETPLLQKSEGSKVKAARVQP
jgi:small-conductance mechanosensitive channel